ncbi:MAG: hypothetical protein HRT58_08535 [Crocinitomicaceae bacterium]|nr:hypothetical protein [Flavobacteriales bacterium]NQZ35697.1 hypothetical protein [Crocinitomicaceae bacterium]
MKDSTSVMSSVFGVFLLFIISGSSTFAQTPQQNQQPITTNEFPVAKVTVVKESNASWYTFRIIHEIPEWKAERLEERLLLRYTDIQSIEIDAIENYVRVKVLNTADVGTISRILSHFKYNGYEEL